MPFLTESKEGEAMASEWVKLTEQDPRLRRLNDAAEGAFGEAIACLA